MKKTICNIVYDTETSQLIAQRTQGQFGDAAGYEETLYRTPEGKYFLYVNGGAESIHPEEKITRMAEKRARAWAEEA